MGKNASSEATGLWQFVLVLVALTAGFFAIAVWRMNDVHDPRVAAIEECRSLYARARTFADTLRADRVLPQRGTATGYRRVLSCWDLRQAALLRPRGGAPLPSAPATTTSAQRDTTVPLR